MSLLQVEQLSFHYPHGPTIFHDVSFSLEKGEMLSILGTNGSGKTTLLNCLANLYQPSKGEIRLDGKPMSQLNLREIAKIIGYVPQIHIPSYAYTVREFVVMGRTPYINAFRSPSKEDYYIADQALEKMGISKLRNKTYTEISGGERQQATIARAIAQQPQIILMDEPTAHLDYGNQYRAVQMARELAQEGYALIMTTHNPEHAIILDGKVAILDRQGILQIGQAAEKLNAETLSQLYNLPIKISYDEDAKRNTCVVC